MEIRRHDQKASRTDTGEALVRRLLTPEEIELVAGADGPGYCKGGTDYTQTGGNYTQSGGNYFQGTGTYNMTCP